MFGTYPVIMNWLVVLTILKNMKVSWDSLFFPIYGKIKAMFQTTNQNVKSYNPHRFIKMWMSLIHRPYINGRHLQFRLLKWPLEWRFGQCQPRPWAGCRPSPGHKTPVSNHALRQWNKYPLVMTNIAMESGPFIDGLPFLKMGGSFHGELLNNQRVTTISLGSLVMFGRYVYSSLLQLFFR